MLPADPSADAPDAPDVRGAESNQASDGGLAASTPVAEVEGLGPFAHPAIETRSLQGRLSLRRAVGDGLRSLVGLKPRSPGAAGGGAGVAVGAVFAAAGLLVGMRWAVEWWVVPAPSAFNRWSLSAGWLPLLLAAAACAVAARRTDRPSEARPDAPTLLFWLLVQWNALGLALNAVYLARPDFVAWVHGEAGTALLLFWTGPVWLMAAGTVLLVRFMPRPLLWRASAPVLLAIGCAAPVLWPASPAWYTVDALADESEDPGPPPWTQESLEAQAGSLARALGGVVPGRPGVVELFAITFAPFADEDVFAREAALVGGVMTERFGAAGRWVNLQNHADSVAEVPWATPLNLRRAIGRLAERMNTREDVLFLHLTSHGARDGQLAAEMAPLAVDAVTPADLRRWLDEAGVRYAVVSISACYSGSWIEPLRSPGTLVMTAADATHTSYGCGRRSPLTFFGRAVYDEQLRTTRSFEVAVARARPVIDQREKEAGKTDGYSNPQIEVGAEVRAPLAALVERLESASP